MMLYITVMVVTTQPETLSVHVLLASLLLNILLEVSSTFPGTSSSLSQSSTQEDPSTLSVHYTPDLLSVLQHVMLQLPSLTRNLIVIVPHFSLVRFVSRRDMYSPRFSLVFSVISSPFSMADATPFPTFLLIWTDSEVHNLP